MIGYFSLAGSNIFHYDNCNKKMTVHILFIFHSLLHLIDYLLFIYVKTFSYKYIC